MSKPAPDVRIDDVWQSRAGRTAKVESLQPRERLLSGARVTVVVARLKTGATLVCEVGNFVKHRTLIERDGQLANPEPQRGDVRRIGALRSSDCRVLDRAGACLSVESIYRSPGRAEVNVSKFVAGRHLIERDGKPVPQENP